LEFKPTGYGRRGSNVPYKVVHCQVCKQGIGGQDFPERMAKIRSHYKKKHPKKWKEAIRRGVLKRKAR